MERCESKRRKKREITDPARRAIESGNRTKTIRRSRRFNEKEEDQITVVKEPGWVKTEDASSPLVPKRKAKRRLCGLFWKCFTCSDEDEEE